MSNPAHGNSYIDGGFWPRVATSLIDTLLIVAVLFPVVTLIHGKSAWQDTGAMMSGFSSFFI